VFDVETQTKLYPGSSGDVKITVNNPNTHPVTLTLNNAASMSSASDTGCQNAVFTIPVTVAITST
jgi:hypothetical protein